MSDESLDPPTRHESDVLVIGAGPVGLTAAGDLARLGRTVTVLERRPRINPASRAFATMARTLEVLDSRGLADDLLALGTTTQAVHLFGGATLDLSHLRSRYPYGFVAPQTEVDQALGRYAVEQGATVLRGVEMVAIAPDGTGVTVTARPHDGTGEQTFRARYLIAADGAHSPTRTLLGLGFPGKTVLTSVVLADVKLSDGPAGGGLTLGSVPDGFGFLAPYGRHDPDGSWYRSMTWDRTRQVADSVPVEPAEVVHMLSRSMGRDVGVVEVGWHSRFHSEERQIENYRRGRVFFAGDAAHTHSPMGGQGLNTGVQDAANLSWKLDAVLGGAPDRVLDTYHAERYPIGRRVLFQSGALLRAVTLHAAPARFLRNLLVPALLAVPAVRDAVAGSFAGTELRYGRRGLVGTRAAEIPLAEGRLAEIQRVPGWVLIRASDDPVVPGVGLTQARRLDPGPAVLVRPDGYIAWAGDIHGDWTGALRHWTGTGTALSTFGRSGR